MAKNKPEKEPANCAQPIRPECALCGAHFESFDALMRHLQTRCPGESHNRDMCKAYSLVVGLHDRDLFPESTEGD